jgi:hypothetical protein
MIRMDRARLRSKAAMALLATMISTKGFFLPSCKRTPGSSSNPRRLKLKVRVDHPLLQVKEHSPLQLGRVSRDTRACHLFHTIIRSRTRKLHTMGSTEPTLPLNLST